MAIPQPRVERIPTQRSGGTIRGRDFFTSVIEVIDSPEGCNCITVRLLGERGGRAAMFDVDSHEARLLARALDAAAERQERAVGRR